MKISDKKINRLVNVAFGVLDQRPDPATHMQKRLALRDFFHDILNPKPCYIVNCRHRMPHTHMPRVQ